MKQMKYVFFGAGIIGSVYAAKLHEAGIDVTVVARGKRLEDIKKHGIVLEYFGTGKQTVTPVKVVEEIPSDEYYDVCVVSIQNTQVESALPTLAKNPHIPTFLFMHNTVNGFGPLIEAAGRDRVLIGHANIGGERTDHIIHYMASQSMTMGELDGMESERLKHIAAHFRAEGFGVVFNKNIDAWKRYHMAFGCPMVNAMYMAGNCNYRLSRNSEALRKFLRGIREAFKVLQAHDFPVEPKRIRLLMALPGFLLVPLFKLVFGMKIMDIGGARHARNAREGMVHLSEELLALAGSAGVDTQVLRELHQYAVQPSTHI